jgi:hypothetical protein
MSAKSKPARPKRTKTKANVATIYPASVISMATHNLINMVTVSAVSGTVLLGLLIVKRF